jgi:hypothetical protein
MAANADSSLFCFVVSGCPGVLLSLTFDLLIAFGINFPFLARCLSCGEDADQRFLFMLIYCVGDEQHMNAVYQSDGLPSLFAIDFPVLRRNVKRIVEDPKRRFEADVVLFWFARFLRASQMNSTAILRNDECVYTIGGMSRGCKKKLAGYARRSRRQASR